MKRQLILFIACLTSLFAFSQDTPKVNNIREVVVSTSRIEKDANSEPRSITVIDAKQIAAANVKTLPELLSQQEGLYILGNGMNPGSNLSIFTRGTNANQTLIMIDGVVVNDPSSPDNSFDINDITLNSIERIEIVRGSNSTIYGSGAIGGSINIITKGKGDKPFEALTDNRFGKTMTVSNNMVRYTDNSGIYASVGISSIGSKGIDAAADNGTQINYQPRDNDGFQQNDFIGKLGYDKGRLKLNGTAKVLQKFSDIDKGAFRNDNNYTLETRRHIYAFSGTYHLNTKFDIKANAAWSDNIRTSIDDSNMIAKDTFDHTYYKGVFTGNSLQSEISALYNTESFDFVIGLGMMKEKMNNKTDFFINDFINGFYYKSVSDFEKLNFNQSNSFGFAHADYDFKKLGLNGLHLGAGMRMNNHNVYGLQPSFEISPSLVANGNVLYISYSTGFQSPSLYQLFVVDSPNMLYGNPKLKPQTSRTLEGGVKVRASNTAFFTASVYRIQTKNDIEFVNLFNKNSGLDTLKYSDYNGNTYLNVGTQTNNGIDLSLNIRPSSQLAMAFRYSYVETHLTARRNAADTAATHGDHIQLYQGGAFLGDDPTEIKVVRRPTNAIHAMINYTPNTNFSFRLDAHYVSQRYDAFYNFAIAPSGAADASLLNSYTLLDFQARYYFTNWVSLGLKIDNILNTKYTEIIGFNTRGTMYFLDLRVELNK
jgi:vitamin B12 transporter